MNGSNYDVVIVGAGAAGLTAAIGLARAGFAVAVVEAAAYPGAENWSGCVYFCENLAHPDILGPDGVEALAWERKLVQRGFFATDGHSLLGMTYRDPQAFRHCYTVLRPIYDHHLGQVALRHGVALLSATTAESLIRDGSRVVGVCTNRGPLYGDLVFLAEGDASHLVTREGYERFPDQRETPKFLQGIKQVIELPAGAIEEAFGVGPDEGVAYEMLLRNGSLRGQSLHLNMGGFIYTNRQSLSIGLVLPAPNLSEDFSGDPNLLMEWFENLPVLQPWLKQGRHGTFGAKLIRGGGARDIPRLIDDGLAIGGAASAVGIDFPYPNFTGPATAMGLLLTQAAVRIRTEKCGFTQDALRRHYLEPLQRTHYWRDVEFLRHWPGYVKRTQVFFGRNLDLLLGMAYVWTRPKRWLITKWFNWLRLLGQLAGPGHWAEIKADLRHLVRALRLREVAGRPSLGQLLLDGAVNALRDLFGSPRPDLPAAGTVELHYTVAPEPGAPPSPASARRVPWSLRRWFQRFAPVLASAAQRVYTNDDQPLPDKLTESVRLMIRQVNILDLAGASLVALAAGASGGWLSVWDRVRRMLGRGRSRKAPRGLYPRYALAARQATDLTPLVAPAAQNWEGRLGQLEYQSVKASHIHLLWPRALQEKSAVVEDGIWHVCPAHVYEARVSPQGQLQVVVNFENCIKCETCWRTSELVDWGRDGRHRFIYPVHSPAAGRLLAAVHAAGLARPALPRSLDWWGPAVHRLAERLQADQPRPLNGEGGEDIAELSLLLTKLERKLQAFDLALAEEPRTVDRARAEYLEMLARYAQQLATRIVEVLRASALADSPHPGVAEAQRQLLALATTLATRAEERDRRTWDQRFAWAAADGRQLRQHHLVGLRRMLATLSKYSAGPTVATDPIRAWLRAEDDASIVTERLADWSARLDAAFPSTAWRERERQVPLTSEQDAVLRDLLGQVPALEPSNLSATMHPPLRKALLAELGRRDPSLAYRAAAHLWARDLARLATSSAVLVQAARRWARGDEWACFAQVDAVQTPDGRWKGEALFVPARGARTLLLLLADQLLLVPVDGPGQPAGLTVEPLATLGLRGAGLARARLDGFAVPEGRVTVDHDRILRAWSVLSCADLVSIARGMTEQLCDRTIAHATSRVQFPGLFHDEEARDPIGKFGAVKKMVAEMAAHRYLMETLEHTVSPTDFSSPSVERIGLVKAVVAEALGTAPGSVSYNAGQVFGGTGYSEDDILSKFYRDASAWRFLGPTNARIFRRHGEELLRGWRSDGSRLASLRDEAGLFDQLAQRKALQAELDEVRVVRSRLRGLVNDLSSEKGAGSNPQILEGLARQDAQLLACKALLLRTHARLEDGLPSEIETALVRVWLGGAAVSLDEFEGVVRRWIDPDGQRDDRPIVEPSAGPPIRLYADYLTAACPYDSGDFLSAPVDLLRPRFVPEMIETDPALGAVNQGFRDLLIGQFGQPRDGLPYERYLERQHRPDPADLDFCQAHGFFHMPIPTELGGGGRRKVDYYLLTTNLQRLTDVALSLTIQVSTSIGTTPVMLARNKDLPKAQKDLTSFIGDSALRADVQRQLEALVRLFARPDPRRIESAYQALNRKLEDQVFTRSVFKVLGHRFVEAWQQASRAGKAFDLAAMQASIQEAANQWQRVGAGAEEYLDELGRRREACDLFLRWVVHGQISAFALTEPSAGSDTARIATHARLRSVPVETEPDGVLGFTPADGGEPRYLLDARRLEFRPEGVFYRWSDSDEPSRIRFEEYDYETDDPTRTRFYQHGSRRVAFTDIAQLRQRDGKTWYDYWELTGAKMWITNGRMAGVMCLYAKTDEGVTGFLVDRHAEGLVVGKDEEKMGQCGSPTNELSLQAVRVPRENVMGLEGRGQVNALESLNVGRAGLSMSFMAQLDGLIESSRAFARSASGEIPDWVAWRLARMEEDRFTAEALAHEVVGRFEHPQTRSARMESAIAKMLVSELLHRDIEFAEEIHGLAGQTQLNLVEKRKRDSRVLNIYEGTNEIQRFFILKDLAAEVAPRWRRAAPPAPPKHVGREALELENLKASTRQRIDAALGVFGQQLWQNPSLQANCFLLAETAAWLKAADSTLGRLAWLSRVAQAEDDAEPSTPPVSPPSQRRDEKTFPPAQGGDAGGVGRRALARCYAEVQDRLRRFDEELAHLRRGYYAPEIRAASLLFDRSASEPAAPARTALAGAAGSITRPLTILVIVEPTTALVPHPDVVDGRLLETHWGLDDGDRSALEMALRLREQAAAPVAVHVAAVGPRGTGQALREVLSLGVDRARLVLSEAEAVTPDSAAAALATVLRSGPAFDLILGGSATDGEEGLLARLTAEALGIPFAGSAVQLAVRQTESESGVVLLRAGGPQRQRTLPALVLLEPELTLREFRMEDYLAGLSKAVETERWPKRLAARSVAFAASVGSEAASQTEVRPYPLSPAEAASRLLDEIGRGSHAAPPAERFDGELQDTLSPSLPADGVLAVLAADAAGRLLPTAALTLRAARMLAEHEDTSAAVLLLAGQDEAIQRQALAELQPLFAGAVVLLAAGGPHGSASLAEVQGQLLSECWRTEALAARVIVGEPWTEAAFAPLGGGTSDRSAGPTVLRVHRLMIAENELLLETRRAHGKLAVRQALPAASGAPCWISLTTDAEVPDLAPPVRGTIEAQRWAPRLERFFGRGEIQRLLDELKQETGLVRLADADFIIDVGFGVGNRDGYETVIEPLEQALRGLGVHSLMVGGSRKVTEELHVLPAERQIGQSGVSVHPRILLAIGISGAPQHLNYIDSRTTILAFNRDPEAPIMTLNQRQPRPRVFPVIGDLFETVPALTAALRQEQSAQLEPKAAIVRPAASG
jgi:electron transfer flavoprotein-quinone oxidoreductase